MYALYILYANPIFGAHPHSTGPRVGPHGVGPLVLQRRDVPNADLDMVVAPEAATGPEVQGDVGHTVRSC